MLPGEEFSRESGPVAFISQSGGYAIRFPPRARGLGIRFSKVISYGNACDVNETDLLEYLCQDPETRVITAYIEGVKDGPKFFKLLQEVSRTKPVILWKGGLTQGGARAAYSHTGSLSGEESVWDALFRQSNTIRVDSLDELLDTTVAFLHLSPHLGRKVCVISGSGAVSATAADACEKVGLSVPLFNNKLQEKLTSMVPPVGSSTRNPVDIGGPSPPPANLRRILETVLTESDVDTLIFHTILMSASSSRVETRDKQYRRIREELVRIPVEVKKRFGRRIVMVLPVDATGADTVKLEGNRRKACDYYLSEGIPVFSTLESAAKALVNSIGYYERRDAILQL